MIKFVTVEGQGTASVYIVKNKSGLHRVDIYYNGRTYSYLINKGDQPADKRSKEDLMNIALENFKRDRRSSVEQN